VFKKSILPKIYKSQTITENSEESNNRTDPENPLILKILIQTIDAAYPSFKIFLSLYINALLMSKEEIKHEINKVLDQLSENSLHELLAVLKNVEGKQAISLTDSSLLEKILAEDRELLEKLAK
jgi:hypothetical protein